MMKRLVALMICAVSLGAAAQSTITYPYNPDGNADGDIAVGDLQDFLGTYGNTFSPSEIMVGDSSLTYWVESINESLNGIDSRDLTFPNGLANAESIIHDVYNHGEFVVPEGKQLYFMGLRGDSPGSLTINGLAYDNFNSDQLVCPLILSAGTVISCEDAVPPHRVILRGFLADGIVEPMLLGSEDFVVPDGQMLVISFLKLYGSSFEVNGHLLYESGTHFLRSPLVLTAGDSIDFVGGETQRLVAGYLAPLTFFDYPVSESEEDSDGPCQGELTVNYHGYDYQLVEIGDQCWFAENVRFLPRKATSGANVNQGSEDNGLPYSYVYGEDSNDLDIIASSATLAEFGALYNFQASIVWDLCPSGWHIPSDAEWMTLEAFVGVPESELTSTNWRGTEEEAGKKLKSIFWSGTDEYGFGALPGGARYAVSDWQWSGGPGSEEPYALFMTSSFMNGGEVAIAMRAVRFDEEGIWRGPLLENPTGLSVRCIKD